MSHKILQFEQKTPKIHKSVYIADGVCIIGDVEINEGCSIWFNSVVRGDVHYIRIGKFTNIQDNSVIHVTTDKFATIIGDNVVAGHRVIIHGATISDNVLIGMGAIIMDGAQIGEGSLIGAGALIVPGTKVPPYSLYVGTPAKFVRKLKDAEIKQIKNNSNEYYELAQKYKLWNV